MRRHLLRTAHALAALALLAGAACTPDLLLGVRDDPCAALRATGDAVVAQDGACVPIAAADELREDDRRGRAVLPIRGAGGRTSRAKLPTDARRRRAAMTVKLY